MKLKDIADMEDYLSSRCYCVGEIYDTTGFFFQVFSPEADCVLLSDVNNGKLHGKFVIAKSEHNNAKEQIIYIEITDSKVDSCVRIDATDHNINEIKKYLNNEIKKMSFNEYDGSNTGEELKKILSIADAIMID